MKFIYRCIFVGDFNLVNFFADTGIWSVKEIRHSESGFVVRGCYGHVSVYEPLTNQIIGHGGYRGIILNDTWAYDLDKGTLYVNNQSSFLLRTRILYCYYPYGTFYIWFLGLEIWNLFDVHADSKKLSMKSFEARLKNNLF